MSKFQLPTQKGTEVFPQVTQAPTKVRFDGVPAGSAAAAILYRAFAPQINHFHRSQAQKYSLSTTNNYRAHGTYEPGLGMTYTNLMGQEVIQIAVATEIIKKLLEEQKGVPDFAVVDIVVNLQLDHWSYLAAELIKPKVEPVGNPNYDDHVEYDDGWAWVNDPAEDYSFQAKLLGERPIIEYADVYYAKGSSPAQKRISSLKIDFRDLPREAIVEVNLYGNTDEIEVQDPPELLGYETGAHTATGFSIIETHNYERYTGLAGGPPTVWEAKGFVAGSLTVFDNYWYNHKPPNVYEGLYLDIHGNPHYTKIIDYLHDFQMTGGVYYSQWTGAPYWRSPPERPINPSDVPYYAQNYKWVDMGYLYIITRTSTWEKVPVYSDNSHWEDVHVTCDVVGQFYDTGATFVDAKITAYTNMDVAMWLMEDGKLPERHKIGECVLTSTYEDDDNLTGYSYLGKIKIDRLLRSMTFEAKQQGPTALPTRQIAPRVLVA